MERASRFIVEHVANEQMFTDVMATHYLKCVPKYYELVHVPPLPQCH